MKKKFKEMKMWVTKIQKSIPYVWDDFKWSQFCGRYVTFQWASIRDISRQEGDRVFLVE